MTEMFNNYPQPEDYIPDNRPKPIEEVKIDIMTGGTAIHTFEVPFNVSEECNEIEVIYKQGIKPIIIKNSFSLEVVESEGKSIVTSTLSPEETQMFKNNILKTRVQMKFYMKDDSVIYSEIYKVTVRNATDINRKKPEEDEQKVYGVNYGYTED